MAAFKVKKKKNDNWDFNKLDSDKNEKPYATWQAYQD